MAQQCLSEFHPLPTSLLVTSTSYPSVSASVRRMSLTTRDTDFKEWPAADDDCKIDSPKLFRLCMWLVQQPDRRIESKNARWNAVDSDGV